MTPTLKDFEDAACKWRGSHNDIAFELSWHDKRDYNPHGTWCWYLLLPEEQFNSDDWSKLRLKKEDKQMLGSSWHRHWGYDDFPDLEAHGGWTWGELTTYLGKDGKEYEHVKVGCDYAHLWDREEGYWQGRSDIQRDAERSIKLFCEMFPNRRFRCGYSGKWDSPEKFYLARNDVRVHVSQEDQFNADNWPMWMRAESVAA